MKPRAPESKLHTVRSMVAERRRLRRRGLHLVFTNGCFDILHSGHVDYLGFARRQGDALVVGLNSDSSVRLIKGPDRPLNRQADRARTLAALEMVDYVVIFGGREPRRLIAALLPDILVKGEDWSHYVSGRDIVEAHGGRVVLAPLTKGRSTTRMIQKIRRATPGKGRTS